MTGLPCVVKSEGALLRERAFFCYSEYSERAMEQLRYIPERQIGWGHHSKICAVISERGYVKDVWAA